MGRESPPGRDQDYEHRDADRRSHARHAPPAGGRELVGDHDGERQKPGGALGPARDSHKSVKAEPGAPATIELGPDERRHGGGDAQRKRHVGHRRARHREHAGRRRDDQSRRESGTDAKQALRDPAGHRHQAQRPDERRNDSGALRHRPRRPRPDRDEPCVQWRLVEHGDTGKLGQEPVAVRQDVPGHHRESGLVVRREHAAAEIKTEQRRAHRHDDGERRPSAARRPASKSSAHAAGSDRTTRRAS